MQMSEIERQARLLARENRRSDPEITDIFWFPHDDMVRLVEVLPSVPPEGDGEIHPFYFQPSPEDDLPSPSGVALIHPNEVRRAKLPGEWGDWSNAVELGIEP